MESIINMHGYKVHRFFNVTSTMDVAKEHLAHGHIIWADTQAKGKGRFQRQWVSPVGNLYMTLVWDERRYVEHNPFLPFICSLALYKTLEAYLGENDRHLSKQPSSSSRGQKARVGDPGKYMDSRLRGNDDWEGVRMNNKFRKKSIDLMIKWPNDLLIEGKKISGILIEKEQGYYLIGIGINIVSSPNLQDKKTCCLKDFTSSDIDLEEFLSSFLSIFHDLFSSPLQTIIHEWERCAHPKGTKISCKVLTKELHGLYQGITPLGHLMLEGEDGVRHEISSGDVFLHRT